MNNFVSYVTCNGGSVYEIDPPKEFSLDYAFANPTCLVRNNEIIINNRCVNYTKLFKCDKYPILHGITTKTNQFYYNIENGFKSINVISKYKDGRIYDSSYLSEPCGRLDVWFKGLEDVRLVEWNNIVYAYGTRLDMVENLGCICIYKLDDNFHVEDEIIVKPPFDSICEKNWAAICDKPFHFVYYANPTKVIKVNQYSGEVTLVAEYPLSSKAPSDLRGNSNLIRINDDSYVELVHQSIFTKHDDVTHLNYKFYFIIYNNNFEITNSSREFNFRQNVCEFSCGMQFFNNKLYLPFCEFDCASSMLEIPINAFEGFILSSTKKNIPVDNNYFTEKGFRMIYRDNPRMGIPYLNYSLLLNDIDDDTRYKCLVYIIAYAFTYLYMYIDSDDVVKKIEDSLCIIISEFKEPKEIIYMYALLCKYNGEFDMCEKLKHMGSLINRPLMPKFSEFINMGYV